MSVSSLYLLASAWAADPDCDQSANLTLPACEERLRDILAERPEGLPSARVEYYPRDRLSLVRGGVDTHNFRLGYLDVPLLSFGLAGVSALRAGGERPKAGNFWAGTAPMAALQLAPSLVVLETGPGTGLRNVGRSLVVLEATVWSEVSYTLGAMAVENGTAAAWTWEPASMDATQYGRVAGATGGAVGWYTVFLRSRRRRALALDAETLLGTPLVAAGAGSVACLTLFATEAAERFEPEAGACALSALTGALTGVILPSVHVRGGKR